jgi:hypothetical protein
LNLPDLLHFVAGSNLELAAAAAQYALAFSGIYTSSLNSLSTFDMAVCTSVTGTLLKSGSIAENLTIYTQSTAIQAWKAIVGLADVVNQTVDQIYTIYNAGPTDVDFPFLVSVHEVYRTVDRNATAANVVSGYAATDKTVTSFNLETSPAPSLALYP